MQPPTIPFAIFRSATPASPVAVALRRVSILEKMRIISLRWMRASRRHFYYAPYAPAAFLHHHALFYLLIFLWACLFSGFITRHDVAADGFADGQQGRLIALR